MKYLKGCLIVVLIFISIIICLTMIFNHRNSKQIVLDNEIPKNSLTNYKSKILKRNHLIMNSNLPDSIKVLAKNSDSIIKNYKKLNNNLWTEYRINQNIYKIEAFERINQELNESYIQYNSDVKDFNSKWLAFPFNLALSDNNLRSYEFMYLINYGNDNTENMDKRKKVEHWIKTGEVIQ